MTELLFYHLQHAPLERVLPDLVQRSLTRGWRCVVEASRERLQGLDDLFWTFADESFLPHGLEADDGADQPVVLVDHGGNPNGSQIRFMLDSAGLPQDATAYERLVILFDGNDAEAIDNARTRWREAKALGIAVTYWQQNDAGRWERRG